MNKIEAAEFVSKLKEDDRVVITVYSDNDLKDTALEYDLTLTREQLDSIIYDLEDLQREEGWENIISIMVSIS